MQVRTPLPRLFARSSPGKAVTATRNGCGSRLSRPEPGGELVAGHAGHHQIGSPARPASAGGPVQELTAPEWAALRGGRRGWENRRQGIGDRGQVIHDQDGEGAAGVGKSSWADSTTGGSRDRDGAGVVAGVRWSDVSPRLSPTQHNSRIHHAVCERAAGTRTANSAWHLAGRPGHGSPPNGNRTGRFGPAVGRGNSGGGSSRPAWNWHRHHPNGGRGEVKRRDEWDRLGRNDEPAIRHRCRSASNWRRCSASLGSGPVATCGVGKGPSEKPPDDR